MVHKVTRWVAVFFQFLLHYFQLIIVLIKKLRWKRTLVFQEIAKVMRLHTMQKLWIIFGDRFHDEPLPQLISHNHQVIIGSLHESVHLFR